MADDTPDDAVEPKATQDWIGGGRWGHPKRTLQPATDAETPESRQAARDDLKRVDDPDASRFLRENPDADIYDFNRWVDHGRLRGTPRYSRGMGR